MSLVYIEPENPKVISLANSSSGRRYIPLTNLKKYKKDLCCWCLKKLDSPRKKYCSSYCSNSAWMFFSPQRYARNYLLLRQKWKCAICRFQWEKVRSGKGKLLNDQNVNYYKTLRGQEVDHIVPIHQGGEAVGLDNVQMVCSQCHRLKSGNERRGDCYGETSL